MNALYVLYFECKDTIFLGTTNVGLHIFVRDVFGEEVCICDGTRLLLFRPRKKRRRYEL